MKDWLRKLSIIFLCFGVCYCNFDSGTCVRGSCDNGSGVKKYSDGTSFVGNFKNGNFHGFGSFIWRDGTSLVGYWIHGEPDGWANIYQPGSVTPLRGRYESGEIVEGKGIFTFKNGNRYVGSWKDRKKNGPGKLLNKHGEIIKKGIWKDDKIVKNR